MRISVMAWRNLWRNHRRTGVTIAAMTLGLLVMILYTGMVEGYLRAMEKNLIELELGDIQIHAEGYFNKPSIYARMKDASEVVARLEADGYRATPRLLGGALAAAKDASAGAQLRGVDVAREAQVSGIGAHVAEGEWLDPARPDEVVIGRRLARTLDVRVGDELVVLSQAVDGSTANALYRVRGVLKAVSDGTDRAGVFMTSAAFLELFVFEGGAHQIVVRRPEGLPLEAATARAQALAPGYDVRSWRQLSPMLASMFDSTRSVMTVLFLTFYVVIAILILNALLMAVFERIREFGVLKAVGVGPRAVLLLIVTESAYQTLISVGLALILTVPGFWYLSTVGVDMGVLGGASMMGIAFDPVWRAVVTPQAYLSPLSLLVVIVSVATLIPAIKAARISPLEALRHT